MKDAERILKNMLEVEMMKEHVDSMEQLRREQNLPCALSRQEDGKWKLKVMTMSKHPHIDKAIKFVMKDLDSKLLLCMCYLKKCATQEDFDAFAGDMIATSLLAALEGDETNYNIAMTKFLNRTFDFEVEEVKEDA